MRASSMRRDNRERFQMHAFRQIAPATLICIREPTLGAGDHCAIGHSHVLAKSRSEMSDRAKPAACRIALSSFSENITDTIVRASFVILPRQCVLIPMYLFVFQVSGRIPDILLSYINRAASIIAFTGRDPTLVSDDCS